MEQRWQGRREGLKSSSETKTVLTHVNRYLGEQRNKQTIDITSIVLCLPPPLKQHVLTQLLLALKRTEYATEKSDVCGRVHVHSSHSSDE